MSGTGWIDLHPNGGETFTISYSEIFNNPGTLFSRINGGDGNSLLKTCQMQPTQVFKCEEEW